MSFNHLPILTIMEFITTKKVVNAYYGMGVTLYSTERWTMAEFIGDAPSVHALQE